MLDLEDPGKPDNRGLMRQAKHCLKTAWGSEALREVVTGAGWEVSTPGQRLFRPEPSAKKWPAKKMAPL